MGHIKSMFFSFLLFIVTFSAASTTNMCRASDLSSIVQSHDLLKTDGSNTIKKTTLKTIINENFPPYTFINKNGNPDGFSVDLAKAVTRAMGLDLTIQVNTREHAMDDLKSGIIDFLPMMSYSKDRDKLFDFSSPHTIAYDALFTLKSKTVSLSLDRLQGLKIIVMKNDQAHDYLKRSGLIHKNQLILCESLNDAMRLLASGEGDVALVPKLIGLTCIRNLKLDDISNTPIVIDAYSRPFCFAVKEGNQNLLEKLSQGLSIIKETGEYRGIYDKWFGQLEPRGISFRDAFKYAASGILGFTIIGVILLLWSITLRRQVRARTNDLRLEILNHQVTEDSLRRSESILRKVLDTLPVGVWIADEKGKIISGNPAIQEIWKGALFVGPERFGEYKGRWLKTGKRIKPEEWGIAQAVERGESLFEEEIEIECFDGEKKIILYWAAPIFGNNGKLERVISVNQDISERKRAEAEQQKLYNMLAQAQKMESIGRLAGGVAHDFNNMLSIIMGYAEMALLSLPPSDPLRTNILQIISAGNRTKEVVRQLLAFARKQPIAPKILDLNIKIDDFLNMLRRLIGENIELQWKPSADLWPVKMDPSQIDQILTNLVVNARDAINGVGMVTIETANVVFDIGYCETHAGFKQGEYVLIAVSDNGCGMDKDTQANIFEPFYTTKGLGKGTGLGLATVYGVAKQNDGFVNVYSEIGQGTTFKIYIPRFYENEIESGHKKVAPNLQVGNETVMIVENEPLILKLGKAMLESLGYKVLTANSPHNALQLAEIHSNDIHLLMTDVVMPGMAGCDLARKIESFCPKIKNLFMSGYTANFMENCSVLDEDVHFIQKPFSLKDLSAKVREVLC